MGSQQRSPSATMEIVASNYVTDTPSPIDLRTLGPLAHTAQMQYQRQMKTLQALQRQAELTAESNAAWRERERRREVKYANIDMEKQALREQQAEINSRVAEARAAKQEAAMRHEEAMRAAAAAKVQAAEERLARFKAERANQALEERERYAAVEARREATYRTNQELMEERRQAILAREKKVEDMLRQRDELRQLQAQIKAEEDYLREQQRRAIKARAEDDLAGRVAHFHAKVTAKDELTNRRKKNLEDTRRMRADELRQRFEYIAAQAQEAAAVAEAERQALAERLEDKAARGEALAAQRAQLLAEMQHLRHQMQRQEEVLRNSLLRMRQAGSVALPAEVVRSLEGLQVGGPIMATAVLGGSRSPLLLEGAPSGYDSPSGLESPGADGARGLSAVSRRRPKSAGTTPRSPGVYSPAATTGSPRVGQQGGRARRRLMDSRPATASPGMRDSAPAASPPTPSPIRPDGGTPGAVATPTPYAPYSFSAASTPAKPPSLEEQVAAKVDTSEQAALAAASGQYSGVHEVAQPGSRREEELRQVLQEEIAKESERQAMLAQVTDEAERSRLVKYFTLEREEAKKRILALSNAAQAALYQ